MPMDLNKENKLDQYSGGENAPVRSQRAPPSGVLDEVNRNTSISACASKDDLMFISFMKVASSKKPFAPLATGVVGETTLFNIDTSDTSCPDDREKAAMRLEIKFLKQELDQYKFMFGKMERELKLNSQLETQTKSTFEHCGGDVKLDRILSQIETEYGISTSRTPRSNIKELENAIWNLVSTCRKTKQYRESETQKQEESFIDLQSLSMKSNRQSITSYSEKVNNDQTSMESSRKIVSPYYKKKQPVTPEKMELSPNYSAVGQEGPNVYVQVNETISLNNGQETPVAASKYGDEKSYMSFGWDLLHSRSGY